MIGVKTPDVIGRSRYISINITQIIIQSSRDINNTHFTPAKGARCDSGGKVRRTTTGGNRGERIQQGQQSGQITRGESRQLRQDRRQLKRTKERAIADGEITNRERRQIKNKKQEFNQDIYQAKNNDRNYDLNDEGEINKRERRIAKQHRKQKRRNSAEGLSNDSTSEVVESDSDIVDYEYK